MGRQTGTLAKNQVPVPVLVYGPLVVVWSALSYIVRGGGFPIGPFIGSMLFAGLFWYGLWRRNRVVWVVALVLNTLAVVLGVGHLWLGTTGLGLMQLAGSLVVFALLLSKETRTWIGALPPREGREPPLDAER